MLRARLTSPLIRKTANVPEEASDLATASTAKSWVCGDYQKRKTPPSVTLFPQPCFVVSCTMWTLELDVRTRASLL